MVLGLFKKPPRLEVAFEPARAVARELAREIEVVGEIVVRNLGKDVALSDLALVLIAGGTRRIDLALPAAWAGTLRLSAGGELREKVAWKQTLAAPMRAPAAELQLITTAGGKHHPLATSARFPLGNE
jgi:hypothetical protein